MEVTATKELRECYSLQMLSIIQVRIFVFCASYKNLKIKMH